MGNLFGCTVVEQGTFGVLETCGKYSHNLSPGFHCLIPCAQCVQYTEDMRQRHTIIEVETKTSDNVFCRVEVAIFYCLIGSDLHKYVYEIHEFPSMMESVVQDQIRSILCKITLDESFATKLEMTSIVKDKLVKEFQHFGIQFVSVIVNDIFPDNKVRDAMNEINRQERLRIAIESEAEAKKTQLIKAAEAEAEAKKLSGVGLAEQRRAIVDGLTTSISEFVDNVEGVSADQVMQIVMLNQYFDTLKELAYSRNSNCVFLPSAPSSNSELYTQVMTSSLVNNSSHSASQAWANNEPASKVYNSVQNTNSQIHGSAYHRSGRG